MPGKAGKTGKAARKEASNKNRRIKHSVMWKGIFEKKMLLNAVGLNEIKCPVKLI